MLIIRSHQIKRPPTRDSGAQAIPDEPPLKKQRLSCNEDDMEQMRGRVQRLEAEVRDLREILQKIQHR